MGLLGDLDAQLTKGTPVYVEGRLRTRTFTNADCARVL
jgi:single-stranded DNA-binding protein